MTGSIIRLLSICMILIYGCGPDNQKQFNINGSWKLQDVVPTSGDAGFDQSVELKKKLKEGAQISFFKDRNYSFVTGNGEYFSGSWSLEGNYKKLVLSPSISRISNSKLEFETKEGKSQLNLINDESGTSLIFFPAAVPLTSDTEDPFHPRNNLWRVKAKAKENETLIRERLKNYIRHFALILKAAKDRNQSVVNFEFSLGPVKIYNGAIGIYPFEMVPIEWKKSFYDEADTYIAYQMFEQVLNTQRYNGASSGNWIDDDYNILLSICGYLDGEGDS